MAVFVGASPAFRKSQHREQMSVAAEAGAHDTGTLSQGVRTGMRAGIGRLAGGCAQQLGVWVHTARRIRWTGARTGLGEITPEADQPRE